MKKLLLLISLFIVGTFAPCLTVFAAEYHTFSLGPEVSYIKYREPDVMREQGFMYGVDGNYSCYFDNLLIRQEGRFNYGEVDYKNSGTLDNIDDYVVEARSIIGYEYPTATNTTITPYTGIGYRYLNDAMGGKTSSTGAKGYDREITYLYTPIGVELMNRIDNKWSFGATLEYDLFWRGWVKSHLSDTGLGYNDVENTQKGGYGLRGSLKFLREWDDMDLIIEPFIRYWNIKKSDDKDVIRWGALYGYGYEPKNDSTEGGLMVTCRWGSGRNRPLYRGYKKPTARYKTEVKPIPPKMVVSADDYYERVRRDIALAVSGIKTAEKGNTQVNITLSSEGRILALRLADDRTNLSDCLRQEIINLIHAVAPFPKIPASIYKSEVSFSTFIVFE